MGKKKHSDFGPSAAARWMNCPGSVKASRGIKDESSPYAREGSAAHELAEKCLEIFKGEGTWSPYGFVGTKFKKYPEWPVTQEMAEAVEVYLNHVIDCMGADGVGRDDLKVEEKIDLKYHGDNEIYGTSDASFGQPYIGDLHVFDYKHGQGVTVSPEMNAQAMIYAIGAADSEILNYNNVYIHIVQPRARSGAKIKTWMTKALDLYNWMKIDLFPALNAAKAEDAPLVPGDKQCMWCRAKRKCKAIRTKSLSTIEGFPTQAELSDQQISEILGKKKMIVDWLEGVKEVADARLVNGGSIPGWKLVEGRTKRKWDSPDKVMEFLRGKRVKQDQYCDLKLKTCKALDTLFSGPRQAKNRAELTAHIVKPEGKPTLVVETDSREAIAVGAAAEFADLLN